MNELQSAWAWLAISFGQAAKFVLGFSGIFLGILATDYPAYNVLAFSPKCGERALSEIAHGLFSNAILFLLLSVLAAAVSMSLTHVGVLALHMDNKYDVAAYNRLLRSWVRNLIIIALFAASVGFAWIAFARAGTFFDNSTSSRIIALGGCAPLSPPTE